MKKKVLFVGAHNKQEIDFYILIAQKLAEQSVESKFIAQYQRHAVDLLQEGVDVVAIPHFVETNWQNISSQLASVEETAEKYNLLTLRQVFNGDRELFFASEAECVDRTLRYFDAYETLFDSQKFNAVVSAIGGELIRTTSYFAAKRRGIKTLYLNFFPLPKKFVLVSTLHGNFLELELDNLPELSVEQMVIVQEVIDQLINQPPRFFRWQPPKFKPEYISKTISRGYYSYVTDRYAYPRKWIWYKSKYISQRIKNSLSSPILYEKPEVDENYFFFPLHDSEDFQLRVRAPHCQYQEYIVRLISDALPTGYRLYVKEHPNFLGGIPSSTLKRIKSISNVSLLSPGISSLDLISNAKAIVTINSTVGFESILRNKSVVTLGDSFYRGHGITIDVDNFYDIRAAIKLAMNWQPEPRLVQKFFHYATQQAFSGDYSLRDFSDENVTNIADAILTKLHDEF